MLREQQLSGDINLITLLMGAQGKGLQVLNNSGEWIDAVAEEDEVIVNIGDMLSRHTNNKLKSTIHRVVNPQEVFGTVLDIQYPSSYIQDKRCL